MPNAAVLFGLPLTTAGPYIYNITINGLEIASKTDLFSLTFQDNGDDEPGRFTARLWDSTGTFAVPEGGVVRVYEVAANEQVWLGYLTRRWYDRGAIGRWINLEAISASALLDEILVPFEVRPVESDQARALYLWGKYARPPLNPDPVFVTQTNAALAADTLADMTLRSALAQTLGLAGSTTRMGIDALGRLHWFAGTETNNAPFNVNVANPPGGGNIAPNDVSVDRDGMIKNRAYIHGANALGSGWEQDDASVNQYGPRETYLDAPSSDTALKRRSIAVLYFGRVAQPRTRGTFSTKSPNDGWRSGQNVVITDAANDLSAQSFRIARVTTTFYRGDGKKRYGIEFGGVRARSSDTVTAVYGSPTDSVPVAGGSIAGAIGGPDLSGISVSDALGVQRVLLGQIGTLPDNPDYGLKVLSIDGVTVVIDGSSNMFKIQATGTQTRAFPAGAGSSTTFTTINGTGGSPFQFVAITGTDDSSTANTRAIGLAQAVSNAGVVQFEAIGTNSISGGDNRIGLTAHSASVSPGTTAMQRWYLLKEAGI